MTYSYSRSLDLNSKKNPQTDEWALINQQKSLEEQKSKMYEQILEQEKKKKLKEQLEHQIWEKNSKELAIKNQEQRYADIAERNMRQAQYEEMKRQQRKVESQKQLEMQNRHLFGGIVEAKYREYSRPDEYAIDFGHNAQMERARKKEQQRKQMIDELDRQIHLKEMQKTQIKREQYKTDIVNLNFQAERMQKRDQLLRSRYYGQNPHIYEQYQQISQRQKQKEQDFQRKQVDEARQKKIEQELRLAQQKDMNNKYKTEHMKQVLNQQIKIKDYYKKEEERVNPQELTYGTIGKMLAHRSPPPNKHQYFLQLQRQIEQKEKRREAEKFMSEQEYKINLNQLNRVVSGKYANQSYIDRSIHALSDSHKVNISLIDARIDPRPQAQSLKLRLEEIKAKKEGKLGNSHNFALHNY